MKKIQIQNILMLAMHKKLLLWVLVLQDFCRSS
jgi:hypothetical protein